MSRCVSLLQFLRAWRCWLSSRRLLILETTDSLPTARGEALSPRTAAALAGQPRAVIALHEAVAVQHKKIVQQKLDLEREKSRATVAVRNANAQKQELSKLREQSGLQPQPRRAFSSSTSAASASPAPSARTAIRRSKSTTSRSRTEHHLHKSAQSSLRKNGDSSRFLAAGTVGDDASGSRRTNASSLGLSLGRPRAGTGEQPPAGYDSEPPLPEGVPPSSLYVTTPHRRSPARVPATPQSTGRALVDATRSLADLDAEQTAAAELSEMSKLLQQAAEWKRAGGSGGRRDEDHADNAAGAVAGTDWNA